MHFFWSHVNARAFRQRVWADVILCALICTPARPQAEPNAGPSLTSDPQAISLAQKSIAALLRGVTISDVTLNANVISLLGSDYETGTGTLRAKGTSKSRVDLNLDKGSLLELRTDSNGVPSGAWGRNGKSRKSFAQHNCWTDAAWFFPALSSLSQTANPHFVFKYIGPQTRNGVPVQHIVVFQSRPDDGGLLQRLSTMDFYLDASSSLPLDIAFNLHADDNMNLNLPTEIRFANYKSISGTTIPLHFQKLINGNVILDISVTSAVVNSGVSDNLFTNAMAVQEGTL